jgi:hypothetical protein
MREKSAKRTDLGEGDITTRCIWGEAEKGDEACEEHQRERQRSMESISWRPNDCLKICGCLLMDICACIVGVLWMEAYISMYNKLK